jgi:hypothetical protein
MVTRKPSGRMGRGSHALSAKYPDTAMMRIERHEVGMLRSWLLAIEL